MFFFFGRKKISENIQNNLPDIAMDQVNSAILAIL